MPSTTPSAVERGHFPAVARRPAVRALAALVVTALVVALGWLTGAGAANATSQVYCKTYSGCVTAGYSNFGYAAANSSMYWRMYGGHNCTNYVAYRMIQDGMPNTRPWTGDGNAGYWGIAMKDLTDKAPSVGSVAWWGYGAVGAGSTGHVAYVQEVISPTEIVISEDSFSGTFAWRKLIKSGTGWPTGFIHFATNPAASAVPSFTDVAPDNPDAAAIGWMGASGVSTGWVEDDGTRTYRPAIPVGRDQMAAFMYRMAGSPSYTAPKTSPFSDLTPTSPFYKEVTWLRSKGVTTGWRAANGTWEFRPTQVTNRDMMAAFMYRYAGKPKIGTGTSSTPADIPAGAPFAAEMRWSLAAGISALAADGTYQPYTQVTRAMMASFMYNYARTT